MKEVKQEVTIKFAGDSGDGMQLTGNLFTDNTALSRNTGSGWNACRGFGLSNSFWKQKNIYTWR